MTAAQRRQIGTETAPIIVAVPVYGSRVLPRFGMARTFWLAERDECGSVHSLGPREWDPTLEPRLPLWLVRQGVRGVLCGGIHPRFQVDLEAEGLWVIWGQRGEIETVLAQWARGESESPGTSVCRPGPRACGCGGRQHRARGDTP